MMAVLHWFSCYWYAESHQEDSKSWIMSDAFLRICMRLLRTLKKLINILSVFGYESAESNVFYSTFAANAYAYISVKSWTVLNFRRTHVSKVKWRPVAAAEYMHWLKTIFLFNLLHNEQRCDFSNWGHKSFMFFINLLYLYFSTEKLKQWQITRYLSFTTLFCEIPHKWGRPHYPTGQFTPSFPTYSRGQK